MKTVGSLTLAEMIEKMIQFDLHHGALNQDERYSNYRGELNLYNEMKREMNDLSESEFTNKYLSTMESITNRIKEETLSEEERAEMNGYRNAIIYVLTCINPKYYCDIDMILKRSIG